LFIVYVSLHALPGALVAVPLSLEMVR